MLWRNAARCGPGSMRESGRRFPGKIWRTYTMKKRNCIAMLLALAMCFSLAACGGDGAESKSEKPGATPAPEFVYASEFTDFLTDQESYISPSVFTEDGFYATSYEKVGENIPEGVTPEYEGQYDVYQSVLYFVTNDGKVSRVEQYKPIEPEENTEGKADFNSSCDPAGAVLANDGNLILVEQMWTSWYEGPDGLTRNNDEYWNYQKYSQKYFIRKIDKTGAELSRAEIPVDENTYLRTYGMQVDDKDNLLVCTDTSIRAIALDGTDSYTIDASDFQYIDSLLKMGDGRVAALAWGEQGQELALIDTEKGAFGESVPVGFNAYNMIPGTGDYDLYYTSGSSFYGFSMETGESEKLFSWLSCDVNGDRLGNINVNKDGVITGFIGEWDEKSETYSLQRVTVKKVPYDSVPHKEIITMACVNYDYQVVDQLLKFNRANDKYRIELKDYSEYNTDEDYTLGLTKLNTEILAGNVPDILGISGLNYTQLASKGLLEDLYPYIDADEELNRDDFFQNVLGAMEVNGKLCVTVPTFVIDAVAGAAKVVGDEPGWTYDELKAALATMPEGCTVLDQYTTKGDILQSCLALDMDNFVDWGTGECRFDSEQFIDLLEFANSFPTDFDWENYEYSEEDDLTLRLSQGRQMLIRTSVYSIEDLMYNNYEQYFGGDMTYIGFPTTSGTGNMISSLRSGYAMSAKSEYKDVIWQFLRTFFMEEYQEDSWSLPSSRKVFEKKLEDACTIQYQKDENDNYLLDDDGEKIPIVRARVYNPATGGDEAVYCLSEEQAAKLTELIESTTKVANYDSDIYDIVSEQAQAYFEGQKSAEEVARLIQSKANIVVNEQR